MWSEGILSSLQEESMNPGLDLIISGVHQRKNEDNFIHSFIVYQGNTKTGNGPRVPGSDARFSHRLDEKSLAVYHLILDSAPLQHGCPNSVEARVALPRIWLLTKTWWAVWCVLVIENVRINLVIDLTHSHDSPRTVTPPTLLPFSMGMFFLPSLRPGWTHPKPRFSAASRNKTAFHKTLHSNHTQQQLTWKTTYVIAWAKMLGHPPWCQLGSLRIESDRKCNIVSKTLYPKAWGGAGDQTNP